MLLLDSTNLSVYEVAEETLSHWAHLPPPITFERFEAAARAHLYSLFLPSFGVGAETLVFVRLARERGWAWASRIRVTHHDQLPINDVLIGQEFLFLWPVPMAIHAYINFKEVARQSLALPEGQETALLSFFNAVKAHPPATAFLPQRFWEHAVETVREVRAKDLTVPQRLFVASLTPHSTALPLRSPEDKWSDKLRAQDQIQLDRFLHKCQVAPGAIAPSAGPTLRARAQRQPCHDVRRRHQRCAFDLPDDLLERILSIHLARSMANVKEMQGAVASARLVGRQFHRTANAAVTRMIVGVTRASAQERARSPRTGRGADRRPRRRAHAAPRPRAASPQVELVRPHAQAARNARPTRAPRECARRRAGSVRSVVGNLGSVGCGGGLGVARVLWVFF